MGSTATDTDRERWDSIGHRMRDGDEVALRGLMEEFGPRLTAYVGRRLNNDADADDLMSHVYEKLWRKRETWDSAHGSYLAWVRTLVRHMITDAYRARATRRNRPHRVSVYDPDDWMATLPDEKQTDTLDLLAREEELDRAMDWIDNLSPTHRRALLLRARDEMPTTDIARTLNVNLNTTKVWLYRARKTMRARRAACDAVAG